MNICFFGASVSEQSRHHSTKEITGYVTYLSEVLASKYDWKISRVTSGSNTIDDAGVIYVHRVVELKPDICILDWATSVSDNCDSKSIEFIYSELLSNKIIPITVIFPRTDRDQSSTPISLMLRGFCELHSLPFIDVSQLIDKSELDSILRDTVHTNVKGAEKYAKILRKELKSYQISSDIFTKYSLRTETKHFVVRKIKSRGSIKNKTGKIKIHLSSIASTDCKVKFFLEQRVGPWSTYIDVSLSEKDKNLKYLQTVSLYDPWCWRERQCLKEITGWIKLPLEAINISQSEKLPDYGRAKEKCNFDDYHKHIRPKGNLYMLSNCDFTEYDIEYHT